MILQDHKWILLGNKFGNDNLPSVTSNDSTNKSSSLINARAS